MSRRRARLLPRCTPPPPPRSQLTPAAPLPTCPQRRSAAIKVDYQLIREAHTESWTLTAQLPEGARAADFAVWCEHCAAAAAAGGRAVRDALVLAAAAPAPASSATATGTLVLVLRRGAELQLASPGAGAGAARSLLAACGPLTVGATAHSFDGCQDLSAQAGVPFELHYSLQASGTGTAFVGGLRASPGANMWAAMAFTTTGRMIGASAVMVGPSPASNTAASVDGYLLKSYTAAAINAGKGSFPLADAAAARDAGGELVAVFTATLPQTPTQLAASPLRVLFAVGQMNAAGQLGTHTVPGGTFGSASLKLQAPAAATPSPSPAAVPSPSPAAAPAPRSPAPVALPSPVAVAPPTPSPSPAAAVVPAPTAQACAVTVGGAAQEYAACFPVSGVGTDFTVAWNLAPDPAAPATSSIATMALTATSSGYVSVGFPSRAGRMVGATAIILQACAACPSGASIKEYYMSGETVGTVQPDARLGAANLTASAAGGRLAGSFTVTLAVPATAARRRRALFAAGPTAAAYPLIYAAGDLTATGGLTQHYAEGASVVDLSAALAPGGGGGDAGGVVESEEDAYKTAHMWLMTVSWGVMIPVGIVLARSFKPQGCWWFAAHRAIQSLGFALALAGLALGFVANGGWETDLPVHRNLGVAATALGLVQVSALAVRPAPGSKYRAWWAVPHHWVGRAAAVLAVANIYYGLLKVEELGPKAWGAYTAVLAAVVVTGLAKDAHDYLRPPQGAAAGGGGGAPPGTTSKVGGWQAHQDSPGEYALEGGERVADAPVGGGGAWTCGACTTRHSAAQAGFLVCAVCGAPRG